MKRCIIAIIRICLAYVVASYLVVPTWDILMLVTSPSTVFADRPWQLYAGAPWIWLCDSAESIALAQGPGGNAALLPLVAVLVPLLFWGSGVYAISKWLLEPRLRRYLRISFVA